MNMDLRQLQHIFFVITLMRGLVTNHSVKHGRPRQNNSKEQTINGSHKFSFYAIKNRMLKRAMPSHPPTPTCPLRRLSETSQDARDSESPQAPA